VGDTFVSRLEREFEEETTARIIDCNYLFVVENRLQVNGKLMQGVDHYFEVTLDREDVESCAPFSCGSLSSPQQWMGLPYSPAIPGYWRRADLCAYERPLRVAV
jgi:hypothetical protein